MSHINLAKLERLLDAPGTQAPVLPIELRALCDLARAAGAVDYEFKRHPEWLAKPTPKKAVQSPYDVLWTLRDAVSVFDFGPEKKP